MQENRPIQGAKGLGRNPFCKPWSGLMTVQKNLKPLLRKTAQNLVQETINCMFQQAILFVQMEVQQ